jgi:hypothetical protein
MWPSFGDFASPFFDFLTKVNDLKRPPFNYFIN